MGTDTGLNFFYPGKTEDLSSDDGYTKCKVIEVLASLPKFKVKAVILMRGPSWSKTFPALPGCLASGGCKALRDWYCLLGVWQLDQETTGRFSLTLQHDATCCNSLIVNSAEPLYFPDYAEVCISSQYQSSYPRFFPFLGPPF